MLQEFWHNFTHNLFKPLLLFFYMGFLVPILKVQVRIPLRDLPGPDDLPADRHRLARRRGAGQGQRRRASAAIVGFMVVGFVLNFFIGILAYLLLGLITRLRRIDKATVAGYYGSDSAGTFVTCVGVLAAVNIAFDAYMPVMLAVMEIPGCLVALYLVSRLRHRGHGRRRATCPTSPATTPPVKAGVGPGTAAQPAARPEPREPERARPIEQELELVAGKDGASAGTDDEPPGTAGKRVLISPASSSTRSSSTPAFSCSSAGSSIGFISGLQGPEGHRATTTTSS